MTSVPAGGKHQPKLGSAQIYILGMVDPEWPTTTPDARSVRVLHSLERHGLVYQNRGRWYISAKGKAARAAAGGEPPDDDWLIKWVPLIDAVSDAGFRCGKWPGGTAKEYQRGPMLEAETAKAALITELRKTVAPIDWTSIDARLDQAVQALGWNKAMGEIRAILREVANPLAGGLPAPEQHRPREQHDA